MWVLHPKKAALEDLSFPVKLHALLELADKEGYSDIVSWQPCGQAFRIHDRDRFCDEVLPRFFPHQNHFSSFQRQLNLYEFHQFSRQSAGQGVYRHERFARGLPQLCETMQRVARKGEAFRSSKFLKNTTTYCHSSPLTTSSNSHQGELAQTSTTSPIVPVSGLLAFIPLQAPQGLPAQSRGLERDSSSLYMPSYTIQAKGLYQQQQHPEAPSLRSNSSEQVNNKMIANPLNDSAASSGYHFAPSTKAIDVPCEHPNTVTTYLASNEQQDLLPIKVADSMNLGDKGTRPEQEQTDDESSESFDAFLERLDLHFDTTGVLTPTSLAEGFESTDNAQDSA